MVGYKNNHSKNATIGDKKFVVKNRTFVGKSMDLKAKSKSFCYKNVLFSTKNKYFLLTYNFIAKGNLLDNKWKL